jgi:hypothetical protein
LRAGKKKSWNKGNSRREHPFSFPLTRMMMNCCEKKSSKSKAERKAKVMRAAAMAPAFYSS